MISDDDMDGWNDDEPVEVTPEDMALARRGANMMGRYVADLIEERMDMGDITTVLYGSMEVTIAALVNCGLPVGTLALAVMDMAEQAKHEQKTAGRA